MPFPRHAALALTVLLAGCPRAPGDTGGDDTDNDYSDDTGNDTGIDTGNDTDSGIVDTGSEQVDCHVFPDGAPDFFGGIPNPPGVTEAGYANDAALDDLVAIANGSTTMPQGGVTVTNVVVTQIGYAPSGGELWSVWVADGQTAMRTYLNNADVGIPVADNPKPGDIVSFTATDITKYQGEIEITDLSGWTKAGTTSAAYVRESTGIAIDYATDGRYVHHVYGELTSDPVPCPSDSTNRRCFTLTHGGADGETIEFRINNVNLTIPYVKGDCVELFAPLSTYGGTDRFDVDDYDWVRWYGNSGG